MLVIQLYLIKMKIVIRNNINTELKKENEKLIEEIKKL